MPIYEYQCERGHIFEVEQSIKDDPLTTCPVDKYAGSNICAIGICNAPVKRLLSPAGIILKGSGWAKDGYSSSGKKPKNKGRTKRGK